jgi:hypothetical protein
MTEIKMNWDYIAGFVDGEGCIKQYKFKRGANRNGYQNRGILTVCQKLDNSVVINEIQEFLLQNGIPSTITIALCTNTLMKTLRVQHRKYLFLLLDSLLPLLIVKKKDATKVYDWLKGVKWHDY